MVIVLSTDNIKKDFRICIIQIDLEITITYMSCLYKSYPNKYNKYNFVASLVDVMKNAIRIYIIEIDL